MYTPDTVKIETAPSLTDRWGDFLLEHPVTDQEREAVETLRESMYEELSFVANKEAQYGLLIEIEYDDGEKPRTLHREALEKISNDFPFVSTWFTQGGHIYNDRFAMRAFIPQDKCTPEIVAAIGKRMFDVMY